MKDYIVSVDLGQSMDYSALTVLHRCWWRKGQRADPTTAKLWHAIEMLLRWPLGTPYPQIIDNIVEAYHYVQTVSANRDQGVALVVDQGGPGRPVIDLLRQRRVRPIGVTITGGETVVQRPDNSLSCPKRDICSALVVAAQSGDVKVAAKLDLAAEFEKEVSSFGYVVKRKSGKVGYEALAEEIHDDLVVSAALGLWYSTTMLPKAFIPAGGGGATVEENDYNPLAKENM